MVAAQVNAMHPQNIRKFISGLMSVYFLTDRKIKIWAALKTIISSIDFIFLFVRDYLTVMVAILARAKRSIFAASCLVIFSMVNSFRGLFLLERNVPYFEVENWT